MKAIETALDKCTDEEGKLHIGKYDHEFLKKVFTEVWNEAIKECEGTVIGYCDKQIDLYSRGTGKTPLSLGGHSYSDHLATGKIEAFQDIKLLLPRANITSDKTTGL